MLTTSGIKVKPAKEIVQRSIVKPSTDPILDFATTLCPKCGSPMFKKRAPCWLRRKGWSTAARCVKCGTQMGYERKRTKVEDDD